MWRCIRRPKSLVFFVIIVFNKKLFGRGLTILPLEADECAETYNFGSENHEAYKLTVGACSAPLADWKYPFSLNPESLATKLDGKTCTKVL